MIKITLIMLIRLYQLLVSPILPPACRYYPNCSKYAVEALEKHGAMKGCWYTFTRLCRCAPWGGTGYDPVP